MLRSPRPKQYPHFICAIICSASPHSALSEEFVLRSDDQTQNGGYILNGNDSLTIETDTTLSLVNTNNIGAIQTSGGLNQILVNGNLFATMTNIDGIKHIGDENYTVIGANGTIKTDNVSTGSGLNGIVNFGDSNSTIVYGAIETTGENSNGIWHGDDDGSSDNNLVQIYGRVLTDGKHANGVFSQGNNNEISVGGSIDALGEGASALLLSGNNNSIVVTGSLTTLGTTSSTRDLTASGITIFGDQNTVNVSGTISVENENSFAIGILGGSSNIIVIEEGAQISGEIIGSASQDEFFFNGGTLLGKVNLGDSGDKITIGGANIQGDIIGDTGSDLFNIESGSISGNIFLSYAPNQLDGDNTVYMTGGSVLGFFYGSAANDLIKINNGEVWGSVITYDGDDTVEVSGLNTLVRGDVALGTGSFQGNGRDEFLLTSGQVSGSVKGDNGVDNVRLNGGFIGTNVLTGGSADQLFLAGSTVAGRVDAGDGADSILVSSGNIGKDLKGGNGADRITIDGGNIAGNVIFGNIDGAGTDAETFILRGGVIQKSIIADGGQDSIALNGGIVSGDVLANGGRDEVIVAGATIEKNIYLGSYDFTELDDDIFSMSSGTVTLGVYGDAGNDQFNLTGGSIGNVGGREGDDTINLNGDARVTQIVGGDGEDTINLTRGTVQDVKWGNGNEAQVLDLSDVIVSGTLGFGAGSDRFTLLAGTVGGDVKLGYADDGEDPEEGEIVGSDQDIFLMEDGIIQGNLYGDLFSGDDITIEGGKILGHVITFQGDDTVNWTGGEIVGGLDGGDGIDTLNLGIAGSSVSAKTLTGWEIINFTGASGELSVETFENTGTLAVNEDTRIATNTFLNTGNIDVTEGNTLTLNLAGNGTMNGQITGNGNFVKDGPGQLQLTSENINTGTITVRSGVLGVDGSLTGNLLIEQTGRLSGSGTVANVISSGVIGPGNSPGTMVSVGDVTLDSNSTYEWEVDGLSYSAAGGAGSYDRIVLTDAASTFTAGGTLEPILRGISGAANNDFTPVYGDTFTIVTTANPNGISSVFDTVSPPTDGMLDNARFDVQYASDQIKLIVTPDSYEQFATGFLAVSNYSNFGRALDAIRPDAGANPDTPAQNFFPQLYFLNGAQLTAAMVPLTGEVHTFAMSDLRDSANSLSKNAYVSGLQPPSEGQKAWIDASGSRLNYSQDSVATRYQSDLGNIWAGFDLEQRDDLRYGLAFGHGRSELDAGLAGTADSTSTILMGYFANRVSDVTFNAKIGVGRGDFETKRSAVLADGLHSATASGSANITFASLNTDYHHGLENGFDGKLWADLSVMQVEADSYAEYGSNKIAASVQSKIFRSGALTVGYEIEAPLNPEAADDSSVATFGFGLSHTFGNDRIYSRSLTMHDTTWDVSSTNVNPTTAFASLGVTYAVGDETTISAAVIGQGNGDYTGVGASLSLVSRF